MANCMGFHTQIASIVEVLSNAFVAEICKLVDDDYAVFRLEITQSQKENRTLRRKLQLLELKVARDRVLASRPSSVKILDQYSVTARGTFCGRLRCHSPFIYWSLHVAPFPSAHVLRCVTQNWVLVKFWIVCTKSPVYLAFLRTDTIF